MIAGDFAVSVRQSREPANLHPGRQVESFHSAGPDLSFWHVSTMTRRHRPCMRHCE
jgi:hypothetical protein